MSDETRNEIEDIVNDEEPCKEGAIETIFDKEVQPVLRAETQEVS